MRPLLWTAAWIAVGFWSLLAWGGWAFFGLFASILRGVLGDDVPGFPVEPTSPTRAIDALHGIGGFVLFTVWAAVTLFILGGAWLVSALAPRRPGAAIDDRYRPPGVRPAAIRAPGAPSADRRPDS